MGVFGTRVLWGYSVRGYYGGTRYEGTMGVLGTRVLWGYPVRGYLSGLCLTPTLPPFPRGQSSAFSFVDVETQVLWCCV
jgi:hypothetical protein